MSQNPLALLHAARHFSPTHPAALGGMKTVTKTAAAVIKATAGRTVSVMITNMGTTSGAFTLNDCATTGAAAATNQILSIPYNTTAVLNKDITLVLSFSTGLVLSAVPGGGTPSVRISYI